MADPAVAVAQKDEQGRAIAFCSGKLSCRLGIPGVKQLSSSMTDRLIYIQIIGHRNEDNMFLPNPKIDVITNTTFAARIKTNKGLFQRIMAPYR